MQFHKATFHVQNGLLYITFDGSGGSTITLDVDDIEKFLKVEKW
jgi:hypothetical protein